MHRYYDIKLLFYAYINFSVIPGIDSSLLRAFCPGISDNGVPSQASKHAEATSPCFLLLLEKENAAHNAASLIESCMIQLTLKGLMGKLTGFSMIGNLLYSYILILFLMGFFSAFYFRKYAKYSGSLFRIEAHVLFCSILGQFTGQPRR